MPTEFLASLANCMMYCIGLFIGRYLTLSACARVTVVIVFVCVCMCVSLTTLEATLIYSTKNGHQWTANGILFILKTQILQIGSFDSETAV